MSDERSIKKPWGSFRIIHESPGKIVKVLTIDPGQSLSLQSHDHRHEHWFVMEGSPTVELDGVKKQLRENEAIDVPTGSKHRISNESANTISILEVQHGEVLSETDIVRYQDRYGRPTGRTPLKRELPPPVSVCEIGCNHKGDIDIAVEMIKVASQFCKVDVVKFQKRCNRELLSPQEYNAPHPVPANSYGATYGEHREFLEFSKEQHRYLMEVCGEWGVVYATSVWDVTSAKEMIELQPPLLKVPSACNTNQPLLEELYDNFEGQIHISLGMTTHAEEEGIVELADRKGRARDVVLYHCISGYPVDDKDLSLTEITRLKNAYGGTVGAIGFSGHHRGIAPDMAALTLGAEWFERHFTLDRSWKGTDHAASLEPNGFRRLARDLRNVAAALHPQEAEILDVEWEQRRKLKRLSQAVDQSVVESTQA
jgi:sialic acid synthase